MENEGMSKAEDFKYFVWVWGLKGPCPQIWDEADKTIDGKPAPRLSKPIKIHFKDERDLATLAKDHPYE